MEEIIPAYFREEKWAHSAPAVLMSRYLADDIAASRRREEGSGGTAASERRLRRRDGASDLV